MCQPPAPVANAEILTGDDELEIGNSLMKEQHVLHLYQYLIDLDSGSMQESIDNGRVCRGWFVCQASESVGIRKLY